MPPAHTGPTREEMTSSDFYPSLSLSFSFTSTQRSRGQSQKWVGTPRLSKGKVDDQRGFNDTPSVLTACQASGHPDRPAHCWDRLPHPPMEACSVLYDFEWFPVFL